FYKPVKHELGWADYQVRAEQAIVRHWQLVLLAYTFSLLVGTLPTATAPPPPAAPASAAAEPPTAPSTAQASPGGGKIGPPPTAPAPAGGGKIAPRTRSPAGGLGGDTAPGAELALPLGTAAALLATLVERRPTARAGRAPRPRRPIPSA